MFCSNCGNKVNENDVFCGKCGNPLNSKSNANQTKKFTERQEIISNERFVVPDEVKRWNWGAFLFTWIWGLSNRVYISLLAFLTIIPVVGWIFGFIFSFFLGIKGNELAYKNQKPKSLEKFLSSQRVWNNVGLFLFFIPIGLTTLFFVVALILAALGLIDLFIIIVKITNFLNQFIGI